MKKNKGPQYANNSPTLTTRQMPSGAQQYVRGETTTDRLGTLMRTASGERSRQGGNYSAAEERIDRAFIDELDSSRERTRRRNTASQNERQTRSEDFRNRRR